MASFVPLHVHTEYSILDGMSNIKKLFARADELKMPGLAITDHGNMYGVKEFFDTSQKYPDIKPILGCEAYVTCHYDHHLKDNDHRKYYHLILLAKNYTGYKNLMKIVSIGHTEGMYYDKPRVSHEVLEKYHEGLICSSACIAGEIPRGILAGDMDAVDKAIEWHKGVFGEDYYLEVMLHKTEVPGLSLDLYHNQMKVNEAIFELGKKHGVKVVATNDTHFIRKDDGPAHDRLICLTTNSLVSDPKRLRYTQQEYLKSEDEMLALFPEHPEAIFNTREVMEKVERYDINSPHILPKFSIDPAFLADIDKYLDEYKEVIDRGRNDEKGNYRGDEFCRSVAFLCHLTWEGARERYGAALDNDQALRDRIDFELKTISYMGFPDYFLIVQDFINWAKNNGISVGPGRGSAAGSVVSYCLRITNLDPVKYDLLFERFLNPERISMPDIDVDFDDEGRYRVIQYVQDLYGADHISHVITFGTMAAKLAVKDVARVSDLSLSESNRLTKLIPDRPFVVKENGTDVEKKPTLENCYKYVPELKKEYEEGEPLVREVLEYAKRLEGCVRQIGIHACAMIIGRGNLTDYIPITMGEDKATGQKVWVSQYEGSQIEDVGMLKMDFLGLKTLSIISRCLALIRHRGGPEIDIEAIPIDDPATFDLYSRGDTKSVFQFESGGMREWLMKLHPERFEDLIAMNALYRPGPMGYIPQFIRRKHGEEPITYDIPVMEKYLKDTYGITVYQEQVMLLSRLLADFTRGESDALRKAMGKKKKDIVDAMKPKFIEGGKKNGHDPKVLDKIWSDWEAFASYAFNKSHAACYSWVAYQTAYLKANYPAEFMAAIMSRRRDQITEITKLMDECKQMGIATLGPDVNESFEKFGVNHHGEIRFGLGAIKGMGESAAQAIISEREKNGPYKDIFDFAQRVSLANVNRKAFESLALSGGFDGFGISREAYFAENSKGEMFLDTLVRYGQVYQTEKQQAQNSLFGAFEDLEIQTPPIPKTDVRWSDIERLNKERELIGIYLSAHPLDEYKIVLDNLCNTKCQELADIAALSDREDVILGGIVTAVKTGFTKNGNPYGVVTIEDFEGSGEMFMMGEEWGNRAGMFSIGNSVYVVGKVVNRFRYNENGPKDLKISNVEFLQSVKEKAIDRITISLVTDMLDDAIVADLTKIIDDNPGKTKLFFQLRDSQGKNHVLLHSKREGIDVRYTLIDYIESHDMLDYKIN